MMEFIFGLIIGTVFGWQFRAYMIRRILKKLNELPEDKPEEIKTVNVSIEKHGELFYLYDSDDGRFLAQGSSVDDVNESLRKRFSNSDIIFNATKENIQEVGYK